MMLLIKKIHDQDAAENIVPGNSHKIKTKGFDDETDLEDSRETFSNLELVGEADDTSTEMHSRDENTDFEKKLRNSKQILRANLPREKKSFRTPFKQ